MELSSKKIKRKLVTDLSDYEHERSENIKIAKRVGFKPIHPYLPMNPTPSTLAGYRKRKNNWLKECHEAIKAYNIELEKSSGLDFDPVFI